MLLCTGFWGTGSRRDCDPWRFAGSFAQHAKASDCEQRSPASARCRGPLAGRASRAAATAARGMRSRCFSIRGLRRGSRPVVVRCRRRHRERPSLPFRSVRRGEPASHPHEDSPFRSIRSAVLRGRVPADLKGGAIGSPEPGVPPEKRVGVVPEPIRDGRHAAGRLVEGENAAGLPGPLSGGGRALRRRLALATVVPSPEVSDARSGPRMGEIDRQDLAAFSCRSPWTAPEASGALRMGRVARKTFTGDLAHLTPHCLSRRIRTLNPHFAARAKTRPPMRGRPKRGRPKTFSERTSERGRHEACRERRDLARNV